MTELNASNSYQNNFESKYNILIKYQWKSNEIKPSFCHCKEVWVIPAKFNKGPEWMLSNLQIFTI